jgi:hypothetical protein
MDELIALHEIKMPIEKKENKVEEGEKEGYFHQFTPLTKERILGSPK